MVAWLQFGQNFVVSGIIIGAVEVHIVVYIFHVGGHGGGLLPCAEKKPHLTDASTRGNEPGHPRDTTRKQGVELY